MTQDLTFLEKLLSVYHGNIIEFGTKETSRFSDTNYKYWAKLNSTLYEADSLSEIISNIKDTLAMFHLDNVAKLKYDSRKTSLPTNHIP